MKREISDAEILAFWIGSIPGIGAKRAERLIRAAGGSNPLSRLFGMEREKIEKLAVLKEKELTAFLESRQMERLKKQYREMRAKGIQYISRYGSGYPEKLLHLASPPQHLYVKGSMPDFSNCCIAIVGARECTVYGRDMARMFGYRLAKAGVQIISGMARGIDGWAHQGALEGGGKTFAVLGSGVDVCYPAAHGKLYESILRRGGILSELRPGTKAKPQHFPMRNRIISGISDGILLVEARQKSGSLITVEAALEQGRDVFVIPGRIGDELSVGCNRLIVQGAQPVLSPDDILRYYQMEPPINIEEIVDTLDDRIYRSLEKGALYVENICEKTGESVTDVMKSLLRLQNSGKIREISRGYFTVF